MEAFVYRRRRPAETPLYRLLESLYERLKGCWEERFEHRYGFWRGLVDGVVARYLDCGILDHGFARIRCPECKKELLLAFSCKSRGLCLSCGAKRAAAFAAFLPDELLAAVGHAQWVWKDGLVALHELEDFSGTEPVSRANRPRLLPESPAPGADSHSHDANDESPPLLRCQPVAMPPLI